MMDDDGGYMNSITRIHFVYERLASKTILIGVLAGYLRYVLWGIGGYWTVLATAGGQGTES